LTTPYKFGNIGTDADRNTQIVIIRPSGSVIFVPITARDLVQIIRESGTCLERELNRLRGIEG